MATVSNGNKYARDLPMTQASIPIQHFAFSVVYTRTKDSNVSCLLWLGCVCYLWQQQGLIAKQHRWDICFTAALHYGWKGDAVIGRKSAFEKIVPVEWQTPAWLLLLL
ncbi:predicted protein [Lichtheimia corymbifera JMRC:FSU:9682]|uniref:Uncharacterized protein n=1 Tax=Lichtheimia corymbifera JMRC:FSU:9682 TaxID=1263082 RepID=A0A068RP70_9FUNG|nr:predicted protein [Lichtheimia corymbifera JMRC:FSU:9682]